MCGICGIAGKPASPPVSQERLLRMHNAQAHRGPDDSGFFVNGGIGLASQRLAILDVSSRGHMPMSTDDGRYWIIHNGEVYNYQVLRTALEAKGRRFRSGTDTEVILEMYRLHGPDMLKQFNGMFAFAIWDDLKKELFIARDRQGVKPLVYAEWEEVLLFASEEKALIAAGLPPEFDESTREELLFFRFVSGERTPFKHIKRLLPGHYLIWKDGKVRIHRWWSLEPDGDNSTKRFDEATERLRELFDDSIRLRRISDVPVGVLLSGGLDSSAMAATMARQVHHGRNGKGDVASFTVRFKEPTYDEGLFARKVAKRWSLKSHELFVGHSEVPQLLEDATRYLDAPIVHNNDLHLLAISRSAKPLVTVLLSGEGSDEIFGGYVRYRLFRYAPVFWLLRRLPFEVPRLVDPSGRLRKSVRLVRNMSFQNTQLFSSAEVLPFEIDLAASVQSDFRRDVLAAARRTYADPVRQVMFYEQHTYLQSVLDRNDRMTMGASIECREPYLDYRIVEWTASLPTSLIVAGGMKKMLLRKALSGLLPEEVLSHPKWGFATPLRTYFREIPKLRGYIQKLPEMEFIGLFPLPKERLRHTVQSFLAGDDALLPLVRQLLMTTVWYEVCVQGRREVFN